ncbi:GNAT family N-acetyltransferase [Aeromonas simiae]|uniref:GNAT family N-acetyltransferase n=1 Tax=Aeromonas simiae TaxID=218936 RepID=UPI000A7DBFBA|nr:GNAT family N-acetyltransferase [Aeromonas simiae]MDO2949364.1 GNAT family N-acetyltransferase [Aeromonas simiae]MDO2952935.1 GNAT family N-acetyltransferase [Aeromonas simiae]MDO2956630.1 GNAT family N-acetyltransferase [Aeromonas simiae]
MIIRMAEACDQAALAALFLRVRRETFHWADVSRFHLQDWAEQSEGEQVWVAEQGERLCGLVSLWQPDWFVHHLYVSREHRGMGIGRRLLEVALDQRSAAATLKVASHNCVALGFYHRLGWHNSDEQGECELTGPWVKLRLP